MMPKGVEHMGLVEEIHAQLRENSDDAERR